jgi:hypothetical protein
MRSNDLKLNLIKLSLLFSIIFSSFFLSGCEKISNSAKNLQSDWVGLDRKIEIYSCYSGKLIKVVEGSIRLNPDDKFSEGASFLVNGKKMRTNMCFVIKEIGIKETPID